MDKVEIQTPKRRIQHMVVLEWEVKRAEEAKVSNKVLKIRSTQWLIMKSYRILGRVVNLITPCIWRVAMLLKEIQGQTRQGRRLYRTKLLSIDSLITLRWMASI